MAALAIAGAALVLLRDDPPPEPAPAVTLGREGTRNFTTLITQPGKAVTFAVEDARNTSSVPVTLISYRAKVVPDGVRFVGDGVFVEKRPYSIDGGPGFPPNEPDLRPSFRRLGGFALDPFRPGRGDRGTQLLIGFKPIRRGFYPITGLELVYMQNGRRRVAPSTETLGVCAVSAREMRGPTEALFKAGGLCESDLP